MGNTTSVLILLFCFFHIQNQAQVTGLVTDKNNTPLSFVNIYLENTVNGTTTNDTGNYELELARTGTYTIVFKYLGFKTHKETITIKSFPFFLDVSLREESISLTEVEVNATDNPANRIIRGAISKRKEYLKKLESYTADFYSKGLIKIKSAPEKILGQDLGDFGGGLDSTRSGIIYLSETISEIAKNKKDYNEKIIASKVSGDDNGFSFNNASDVDISYYNNTVQFGNRLISPIADNAFNYYRYKLLGTFYDDNKNLINQIAAVPKRPKDNVFTGTIYIVEDQWAIYATDLTVTGEQAQVFVVDTLLLKQSFNFSKADGLWLKVLQSIDFQYGIFGVEGEGRFTAGYKNYNLEPGFSKNDFGNEVLSFKKQANKKDIPYWHNIRPVPLTTEELMDYTVKDSLQIIRKSQKYLDSVDAKKNKLTLGSLFFGHTYNNTFKETQYRFKSPLGKTNFNTVQGWHTGIGLDYLKLSEEKGTRLHINTHVDYGFSDHVFRAQGEISYRFNNFSRPYLRVRGGNELAQFNPSNPISPLVNSISTLFFEDNYAKYYDRTFARIFYSQEVTNGIHLSANFGYERRKPVFNSTDYVLLGDDTDRYTSNNPLDPNDFSNAAIDQHRILKLQMTTRIRFGQKYLSFPDSKFNLFSKYPTLYLGYEKGFAASNSDYNFDQLKLRLNQNSTLWDKGDFSYNLRAGTFLNGDEISFVDYRHFNGNETHIGTGYYLDSFHLLPYYALSTDTDYFEIHAEHNFKGYVMGKIPLLNTLNSNLILGGNMLATTNNRPYSEFSIGLGNLGWKKFRFFRLDYVQSNFGGVKERGITIGFQLLEVLNP